MEYAAAAYEAYRMANFRVGVILPTWNEVKDDEKIVDAWTHVANAIIRRTLRYVSESILETAKQVP